MSGVCCLVSVDQVDDLGIPDGMAGGNVDKHRRTNVTSSSVHVFARSQAQTLNQTSIPCLLAPTLFGAQETESREESNQIDFFLPPPP